MKSNLFARLQLNPVTKYSKEEMYLSIESNINNLLSERNGLDQQLFELATNTKLNNLDNIHKYYYSKLIKYEPRLNNLKLVIVKEKDKMIACISGYFGDMIQFESQTDLYLDPTNL
jgi:predicted component of type VI protein secretion system